MTLSGPFVDDVAPPKQKALWFSLLSLFPSLGVAAGAPMIILWLPLRRASSLLQTHPRSYSSAMQWCSPEVG